MKIKHFLLLMMLLLTITPVVFAQSGGGYDLEWYVLDGGGLTNASGGDYQLLYSVGQDTPPGVSSGGNYELIQGFWVGIPPGAAAPQTITDLKASKNNGKCRLDWTAVTEDLNGKPITGVTYNVYRAIGDPYFTPGAAYATGITATTYTDPDGSVLTDASKNAFYIVHALANGMESGDSNRVGTFVFDLVPGN